MNSNGRIGSGSVRALDTRYLNGGAEMVSSTPTLSVTREIEPKSKIYTHPHHGDVLGQEPVASSEHLSKFQHRKYASDI